MSDPSHLGTVDIELEDGREVHVIFYADGRLRFRMKPIGLAIEEAFLSGKPNEHAIIRVGPRSPITRDSTGTS